MLLQFKTQSVKLRKEFCIRFTQENLIEFYVQSIYLIYAGLMVCITLSLAYPKKYVLFIRSTYSVYAVWHHYSGFFVLVTRDFLLLLVR